MTLVGFIKVYVDLGPTRGEELVAKLVSALNQRIDRIVGLGDRYLTGAKIVDCQGELTGEVRHRAPEVLVGHTRQTPQAQPFRGELGQGFHHVTRM